MSDAKCLSSDFSPFRTLLRLIFILFRVLTGYTPDGVFLEPTL